MIAIVELMEVMDKAQMIPIIKEQDPLIYAAVQDVEEFRHGCGWPTFGVGHDCEIFGLGQAHLPYTKEIKKRLKEMANTGCRSFLGEYKEVIKKIGQH